MFEVGFGELLLIGVVALLVLGPERLPRAAKLVGLWSRRARASWYSIKSEFDRELADNELKRSLDASKHEIRAIDAELQGVAKDAASAIKTDSTPSDTT